jgi:hypothetical protein
MDTVKFFFEMFCAILIGAAVILIGISIKWWILQDMRKSKDFFMGAVALILFALIYGYIINLLFI